jgi:hypothetical protein
VAPLYQLADGVTMVTTNGVSYDDGTNAVDVTWTFADDGEKLATDNLDPYVVPSFYVNPAAVARYESGVASLEKAGWSVATVGQYVEAVGKVVPAVPAPPLLDGTWQPNSTSSSFQWLGGAGLHQQVERDDDNHSLAVIAHRELVAAATAAKAAGLDASSDLDAAWRLLMLGEGSDATGVNPIQGEVEYGLAYDGEALRIARDVIEQAKAAMGTTTLGIDTQAGTATPGATAPEAAPSVAAGPLAVVTGGSNDRPATMAWASVDAGHWLLSVTFAPGIQGRSLSVRFPGTLDDIVYTPALLDGPVHLRRGDFTFQTYELALTDGLIGLGAGRWLVVDQGRGHVAAQIGRTTGDVLIHDDTAAPDEEVTWVFHVLAGDEATAAALARSLNVQPRVWR